MDKPSVMVVSHPRSGTHYLINSIAFNFGYSPKEMSVFGNLRNVMEDISAAAAKKIIVKSHHQFDYFKPVFEKLKSIVKIIYIKRNGKDCMASCYHYYYSNPNRGFPITDLKTGKILSFSDMLRADPSKYDSDSWYSPNKRHSMPDRWAYHIKSWEGRALVVTYEEMKQNFSATMEKVGKYLGLELEGKVIEPKLTDGNVVFPRKGVVGDHVNIFSAEDHRYFDNEVKGAA